MRLLVQHHDQFARQSTVPSRRQTTGLSDPLTRGTDRLVAADRCVNQPTQRNLGMMRAPRGTAFNHGSFDPPRTHHGAVAGLLRPSKRSLDHDGQHRVLWLVQQVSNGSGDHIADPSRSVQLDQTLQPEGARPGQTQRPTDGWGGHALSILDELGASTTSSQYQQRLTRCPNGIGRTSALTNLDGGGDQSLAHWLGQPHAHATSDQSYGPGHA